MLEIAAMPRCLVVDDEPALRRVIGRSVERAGFDVIECASCFEVEAALEAAPPSLVILDVGLANSDAGDVLDILADWQCDAFVQLVSGRSEDEIIALGAVGEQMGIRMLAPLTKPFRAGAIREVADRVAAAGGRMLE